MKLRIKKIKNLNCVKHYGFFHLISHLVGTNKRSKCNLANRNFIITGFKEGLYTLIKKEDIKNKSEAEKIKEEMIKSMGEGLITEFDHNLIKNLEQREYIRDNFNIYEGGEKN